MFTPGAAGMELDVSGANPSEIAFLNGSTDANDSVGD